MKRVANKYLKKENRVVIIANPLPEDAFPMFEGGPER